MLSFESDYLEGAHPAVLQSLIDTNMEQLGGYVTDYYSEMAKDKIRIACSKPEAEVFFLVGGTQTNQVVISSLLRSYEGVVSASTGHVNAHEAGAIEYSGHKVLSLPHHDGKISSDEVDQYISDFYKDESYDHMVAPGMVYISHPTEYGTLYSKKELQDLKKVCEKYNIPLYLDGARLGYALAAESDLTLSDIANLTDVFYIGGTKVGALLGEAVVFSNNKIVPKQFMTIVKQHGAMLAKGRTLGVTFNTLFTDNLYLDISKNAINTAKRLKEALKEKGYRFFIESPTNQIFVILDNEKIESLRKKIKFSIWEKYDEGHCVVRFATSWATKMEDVETLISCL